MVDENYEFPVDSSEMAALIHKRVGHISIPYKHYILVWGGFRSNEDNEVYCSSDRIWFYNCTTELWTVMTTKGAIPFPNSGSTAVIIDDYLYMYGGVEELTDDLWRYGAELHCLDLKNLTWNMLITTGNNPKGCDKAAGWVYNNMIYIFGGYGVCARHAVNDYTFEVDPSNQLDRGWNNQLSIYDPKTNHWTTPKVGGVPPRPRAAHTADLNGDKVIIFGGRLAEVRVNDMHVLDLKNMYWTQIHLKEGTYEIPEGRSWHSFNFVSDKRAILFGGLSRDDIPCGDWWECEIEENQVTWHLIGTVSRDQILVWHKASVSKATKELVILGGVTCSPYHMKGENHVNKLHFIPFTPASLLRLSLHEIVKKKNVLLHLLKEDSYLPKCLLDLVTEKLKNQDSKTSINSVRQISVIN